MNDGPYNERGRVLGRNCAGGHFVLDVAESGDAFVVGLRLADKSAVAAINDSDGKFCTDKSRFL